MNTRQPLNNDELFNYLVWLSEELKSKGQLDTAEEVRVASRFASGSPSEFLHEAQKALKQVKANDTSILSPSQLVEITSVIEHIELAFKRIGGA